MDGVANKLLSKLRTLAPAKVRAYDGSDDARDIAVPTRRKRWSQVIESIEAKAWVRVELLDKAGAILGYVENDEAPSAIEEIGPGGSQGNREKWLLELMLRSQDVALKNRDSEFRSILTGMRDLMATQNEAMRGVFQLLALQRDVAADIADKRARLETEGDDDLAKVIKLLESAPELLKVVGPLVMAAKIGKPKQVAAAPAKPNGTPEVKS